MFIAGVNGLMIRMFHCFRNVAIGKLASADSRSALEENPVVGWKSLPSIYCSLAC